MASNNSVQGFLIVIVAVVLAIWLGIGIATDQTQTLLIGMVVGGGLFCMLLGQKIWLLYLFLSAVGIPLVRGINAEQLGQMLLVGFSVTLFCIRRLNIKWTFTELDVLRLILVLCILQVYVRNPVGLNIFGAGTVGGRPYIVMGIACVAGFILSKYVVAEREIKWAMWATIAGAALATPLGFLRGRGVGGIVGGGGGGGGGGAGVEVVASGLTDSGAATRIGRFKSWADILSRIVVSRISPLRAVTHPIWAIVVLLAMGLAAMSGYRNAVAWVGLIFLFGIAYWGGAKAVMLSVFAGIMALTFLALINIASPLPPNVQRALSPFPGSWDERYVKNAGNSTEWRIEMWKAALFTDEWIKNKILGDGLGFTKEELVKMKEFDDRGNQRALGGLTNQQYSMLISGQYHSGPVHTVRIVGYAGLVLLIIVMIRVCVHAHRLIERARGTQWFGLALFFGIPLMAEPIFFLFVFGTYDDAASKMFIGSGLLDLLHKNLNLPAYERKQKKIYQPLLVREREALHGAAQEV